MFYEMLLKLHDTVYNAVVIIIAIFTFCVTLPIFLLKTKIIAKFGNKSFSLNESGNDE